MKLFTYLVAILALATFASAGGRQTFVAGGTPFDIGQPSGYNNPGKHRRVRSLFGRRTALNSQ